jgi:hypothetical protein
MGLFLDILASDQGQSLMRSALKIGGALLIAHGQLDPTGVDTIVGAIVAVVGLLHSAKAHDTRE